MQGLRRRDKQEGFRMHKPCENRRETFPTLQMFEFAHHRRKEKLVLLLVAINREAGDTKLADCSQRIARATLMWLSMRLINAQRAAAPHAHLYVCQDI